MPFFQQEQRLIHESAQIHRRFPGERMIFGDGKKQRFAEQFAAI